MSAPGARTGRGRRGVGAAAAPRDEEAVPSFHVAPAVAAGVGVKRRQRPPPDLPLPAHVQALATAYTQLDAAVCFLLHHHLVTSLKRVLATALPSQSPAEALTTFRVMVAVCPDLFVVRPMPRKHDALSAADNVAVAASASGRGGPGGGAMQRASLPPSLAHALDAAFPHRTAGVRTVGTFNYAIPCLPDIDLEEVGGGGSGSARITTATLQPATTASSAAGVRDDADEYMQWTEVLLAPPGGGGRAQRERQRLMAQGLHTMVHQQHTDFLHELARQERAATVCRGVDDPGADGDEEAGPDHGGYHDLFDLDRVVLPPPAPLPGLPVSLMPPATTMATTALHGSADVEGTATAHPPRPTTPPPTAMCATQATSAAPRSPSAGMPTPVRTMYHNVMSAVTAEGSSATGYAAAVAVHRHWQAAVGADGHHTSTNPSHRSPSRAGAPPDAAPPTPAALACTMAAAVNAADRAVRMGMHAGPPLRPPCAAAPLPRDSRDGVGHAGGSGSHDPAAFRRQVGEAGGWPEGEVVTWSNMEDYLRCMPHYVDQLVHCTVVPGRAATFAAARPAGVHHAVWAALAAKGIAQLFTHQATAIDAILGGSHVVVSTSTSSGKSATFNVPVLSTLARDPAAAVALYLFPTKALAQDQLRALRELIAPVPELASTITPATLDGDTTWAERGTVRTCANIILTNPDIVHATVVPQHRHWERILRRVRFIVLDEAHTYRGVFGTHVALVLRRLLRACAYYGSRPQFICCTATIANPLQHFRSLVPAAWDEGDETGGSARGVRVITGADDGSAVGSRKFIVWNPPVITRRTTVAPLPTPATCDGDTTDVGAGGVDASDDDGGLAVHTLDAGLHPPPYESPPVRTCTAWHAGMESALPSRATPAPMATGAYRARQDYYRPINEWIAGYGVVSAEQR